jgi:cytochrome c biogenesis protein CcdA
MVLFALAFFGGVLTILSPCILPVLPFVFTKTGEPFRRSGLPLLIGMALTFAVVASLAAVGGGWVVQANQYGRWIALALVLVFGVALLLPSVADRLSRPFVAIGNRLANSSSNANGSPRSSLLLGVATGFLWVPCAGPILGLILTGAAIRGANVETSLLLLSFAAGSALSLAGATAWLNSDPLTVEGLRGKVVLVDFWTYSCINCIRALPFVKAWHEKYRDQGLVVIGIHSPEFAFEKDLRNVQREVRDLELSYPVAVDNDYALWRAFSNMYWPAHYFIDAAGNIRHSHFGEGEYDQSERVIQQLLVEAGNAAAAAAELVAANGEGAALPSDQLQVLSPETYVGHGRAEHFASAGGLVPDVAHTYAAPSQLALNEWGLDGNWTVGEEEGLLNAAPGRIVFRFQARDLHLVLGPGSDGKPVKFRVRIDGAVPGDDHGVDIGADGAGTVVEHRLYQLIRQSGAVRDRTFEIEFEDPGVAAYAFTFG